MQIFRADRSEPQKDGATLWFADWAYGSPQLSKIENCRLDNMIGDQRATVYIQGDADTFFSIPAKCSFKGVGVRGYVTGDGEGNCVFRHCYY